MKTSHLTNCHGERSPRSEPRLDLQSNAPSLRACLKALGLIVFFALCRNSTPLSRRRNIGIALIHAITFAVIVAFSQSRLFAADYEAYIVPSPVNFILFTNPAVTIAKYGVPFTAQQFETVRLADNTFLGQGTYHLFKIPNTGEMAVRWTGYGTGNNQIFFSYWNGSQFVIRDIRDAVASQAYEITVNRPLSESHVYILINCTSGQVLTDQFGGPAVWSFSIIAAVSAATAAHYGGLNAVATLITNQINTTVNQRFNAPPGFNVQFNFQVITNYEFADPPTDEILKPHPGFDYMIVYDGFPTQGGGWYGDNYQTIHHSWPVTDSGGPFGANATDGLVHEFGHARGAIDLYKLNVEANSNSVSGQSFQAVRSIMNYPYGERMWDEHSRYLINKNGSAKAPPITYITEAFPPSIGFRVRDPNGNAVSNAQVRLHLVLWGSNSVSTASLNGTTDAQGQFVPFANPFSPGIPNHPWNIQFPNFLVSANSANGPPAYAWMPLYEVQNFHFNFPGSNYVLEITVPFPPVPLKISNSGVRSNHFWFTITGGSNQPVVVEAATNLVSPIWLPVGSNSLTGGLSHFSDYSWSNNPTRFYRLRSQ